MSDDKVLKEVKGLSQKVDDLKQEVGGLGGRADSLETKVDGLDKKFSSKLDRFTELYLDHDRRLARIEETMVTKEDHQDIMDMLHELLRLSSRKDEELTMVIHRVEEHDHDIRA
ncbi:MAG: hypothetical protein ABII07_04510 [Patescibacteria group bacterium]|nr:hypothetical protein [Patescibacteria group bacterium]